MYHIKALSVVIRKTPKFSQSREKNWFEIFDFWSTSELIRFVKIEFAGLQ